MRSYFLLFLILFCSAQLFAQHSTDRDLILKVLEQQRLAWNKGAIAEYMQGYWQNDSLLFVGKNGPTYGWQKTLDNYQKSYPSKTAMGYLSFGIKKIDFIGAKQAFVMGSWHLKREKDELKGYFTLLFRKIAGQWKIVVDHSS